MFQALLLVLRTHGEQFLRKLFSNEERETISHLRYERSKSCGGDKRAKAVMIGNTGLGAGLEGWVAILY